MFEGILTKTYYGNTVGQWGIALAIVLGAILVGKALYWLCSTVLRRLTAKTETKIDDILIDMIEEPIVFAISVAGVWWGLSRLTLPEAAEKWLDAGVEALITLAVTWLVARLLESLFTHYLAPLAERSENTLDDQLLPIARNGTKVTVWALGIIVALNNAGYQIGAVLAGLGIGGLALAMAARDTVSNVFGGFTIFTDRPFSLNDRITVNGYDGVVTEIGIRSTRLKTLAGRIVTIPNATFTGSAVENISAEPWRKVSMTLGLTYDTPAEGVEKGMEILRRIAAGDEDLEEDVVVAFPEFGDWSMNLLFIFYIKKGADIFAAQTRVNLAILREFGAAGLEFAFPTQTLYTIRQPGGETGQAQQA